MKNLTLLFFSLLFIQITTLCQPCLPEGITFTTQEEIDNFQTIHPYCTDIEGNVEISGADITNLNGLNVLTSIGGHLAIQGNNILTSLEGLENLISIEGYIVIGDHDSGANPLLANISGLGNLTFIGGSLWITNNASLSSLSGLENITTIPGSLAIGFYLKGGNPSLTSLSGLEGLISIGGDVYIEINNGLTTLAALNNLNSIGGSLRVGGNDSLTSLVGLESLTSIGGDLYIGYLGMMNVNIGNHSLASLMGLDNLTLIGGDLSIRENENLINLTALGNLNSIGGKLRIKNNNTLPNLTGLDSLTSIGGDILIVGNSTLINLEGLGNIDAGSINELFIVGNSNLSNCEAQCICDFLAVPNGAIEIYDNAPGCNSKEEVEEACIGVSIEELSFNDTFTISPNPCSGSAKLKFAINKHGFVILDLFEISGTKIKSLLNEVKMAGTHEMEIDLSDLPKGIYFCTFKINPTSRSFGSRQTKKLIKLN